MDQIVGHGERISELLKLTSEGRFFNAVIFSGPEGIGKKKIARALLQELNCDSQPACGVCVNCQKLAAGLTDEVFLQLISPDNDKIKIEQVRDAVQFLSLKSWVKHRFVIIDAVEKITTQAANALLKSVEEPPEGVHFIFITANLSQVLPTIRSRCQVVPFSALSREELLQLTPGLEEWQVSWSFGRNSLAQKVQLEEWMEVRKAAINFLHSPQNSKVYEGLSGYFSDAEKIEFILHCWMTYVRDAWLISSNDRQHLYNSDVLGFVEKFSQRGNLSEVGDSLAQIRGDVLGNVDKGLILDNFSMVLSAP